MYKRNFFSTICEAVGEFVFPVFNTGRLGNIVCNQNFIVIFAGISVKSNVGITAEDILVVFNHSCKGTSIVAASFFKSDGIAASN